MTRRGALAGACALGAAGCASLTGIVPFPRSRDIELGRAYSAEVERRLPVERDPALSSGIERIGKRIAEANRIEGWDLELRVVRDDGTVNAFALPGGRIYVFTGLVARADDEAEVAGVLAHEIGHVVLRHTAKRLADRTGIETLEAVLLGRAGVLAQAASSLVTEVGFLSYSRSQESEADRMAVALVSRTGYDPRGIVRFFGKIEELKGEGSRTVTRLLSDHPEPGDRIRAVEREIEKLPPELRTGETFEQRWLAYRELVCPRGPRPAPEILPAPPPPREGT